jgi:hypothetical protein
MQVAIPAIKQTPNAVLSNVVLAPTADAQPAVSLKATASSSDPLNSVVVAVPEFLRVSRHCVLERGSADRENGESGRVCDRHCREEDAVGPIEDNPAVDCQAGDSVESICNIMKVSIPNATTSEAESPMARKGAEAEMWSAEKVGGGSLATETLRGSLRYA